MESDEQQAPKGSAEAYMNRFGGLKKFQGAGEADISAPEFNLDWLKANDKNDFIGDSLLQLAVTMVKNCKGGPWDKHFGQLCAVSTLSMNSFYQKYLYYRVYCR